MVARQIVLTGHRTESAHVAARLDERRSLAVAEGKASHRVDEDPARDACAGPRGDGLDHPVRDLALRPDEGDDVDAAAGSGDLGEDGFEYLPVVDEIDGVPRLQAHAGRLVEGVREIRAGVRRFRRQIDFSHRFAADSEAARAGEQESESVLAQRSCLPQGPWSRGPVLASARPPALGQASVRRESTARATYLPCRCVSSLRPCFRRQLFASFSAMILRYARNSCSEDPRKLLSPPFSNTVRTS